MFQETCCTFDFKQCFVMNFFNLEEAKTAAPQFVGKFQSVTVFEGDSLTLYCKASGEGVSTCWLKDGAPIVPSQKYKYVY